MFGWIRGKRFEPPTAPLRDFWVTVRVRLHERLHMDGRPADAYIRLFGIRCTPLHLPSLLAEQVTDGSVVPGDSTHWNEVSLNDLSRDMRASIEVQDAECVWHASGRIYFPEGDGD